MDTGHWMWDTDSGMQHMGVGYGIQEGGWSRWGAGYGKQEVGCRLHGYRMLHMGNRTQDVGYRMQVYRTLDAGCRRCDTGCKDTEYQMWDAGSGMLDASCGIRDVTNRIGDAGYRVWGTKYGIWDRVYGILTCSRPCGCESNATSWCVGCHCCCAGKKGKSWITDEKQEGAQHWPSHPSLTAQAPVRTQSQ